MASCGERRPADFDRTAAAAYWTSHPAPCLAVADGGLLAGRCSENGKRETELIATARETRRVADTIFSGGERSRTVDPAAVIMTPLTTPSLERTPGFLSSRGYLWNGEQLTTSTAVNSRKCCFALFRAGWIFFQSSQVAGHGNSPSTFRPPGNQVRHFETFLDFPTTISAVFSP